MAEYDQEWIARCVLTKRCYKVGQDRLGTMKILESRVRYENAMWYFNWHVPNSMMFWSYVLLHGLLMMATLPPIRVPHHVSIGSLLFRYGRCFQVSAAKLRAFLTKCPRLASTS
jgi:hypothetical protein